MLNYDLTDDQHDGEEPSFHYVQSPNSKRTRLVGKGSLNKSLKPRCEDGGQSQRSTSLDERPPTASLLISDLFPQPEPKRQDSFTDEIGHIDALHIQGRQDKSGNSRSKQRARKLQLGDIDWYGDRSRSATSDSQPPQAQTSLDEFVKEKKPQCGSGGSGRFHRVKRNG